MGMQSEKTCAVMNGRLGELTWPREGQRENKTLQNTHVPVKIKIMALPAAAAAGGLIILIMATISFCQAADYGFEPSS
jgi:hypothetical protein